MNIKRSSSKDNPCNQSVKTPSGKEIPLSMSMMVNSMARIIQKGNDKLTDIDSKQQ